MKLLLTFLIMRRASVSRVQLYILYNRNAFRHGHLSPIYSSQQKNGAADHLTFEGGGGGEFVCPKPLVTECFSLTYKAIVWLVFLCKSFFCSKSVCRILILLSETPIPPSLQKSNGWPLTDHFSSFWNSVFVFVRSSSMTFSNRHVANNVSNMLEAAFTFAWRDVVQFWPSI